MCGGVLHLLPWQVGNHMLGEGKECLLSMDASHGSVFLCLITHCIIMGVWTRVAVTSSCWEGEAGDHERYVTLWLVSPLLLQGSSPILTFRHSMTRSWPLEQRTEL